MKSVSALDVDRGAPGRQGGFTLLEMIIVMVVIAILGVSVTRFMTFSVSAYLDTAERQQVALAASAASEKILRALAQALPNSVRVGGGCLEWIPVQAQTIHLALPVGVPSANFSVLASGMGQVVSGHAVVNPQPGAGLYQPGVSGPLSSALATLPVGSDQVTLSLPSLHRFPAESPSRRLYLVSTPESYCVSGERLLHHRGYGFQAVMATPPVGGSRTVLLTGLQPGTVSFRHDPALAGGPERVGFRWRMAAPDGGWVVEQEVHLRHVP